MSMLENDSNSYFNKHAIRKRVQQRSLGRKKLLKEKLIFPWIECLPQGLTYKNQQNQSTNKYQKGGK